MKMWSYELWLYLVLCSNLYFKIKSVDINKYEKFNWRLRFGCYVYTPVGKIAGDGKFSQDVAIRYK